MRKTDRGTRRKAAKDARTCDGCGHVLSRHRTYAKNGRNRHGSPLVCIADHCQAWTECRSAAGGTP